MRIVYTAALYLIVPVLLSLRALLPGPRRRRYHERWRERLGRFRGPGLGANLWVHAVSVGEVNAVAPLVEALLRRFPQRRLVLTTGTPTGSDRVRELFGERVFHVYLPFDVPFAVRGFLDRAAPVIAVIMETEIWPNLYHACQRRGIPVVLANARLSMRSLPAYRSLLRPLVAATLRCVTLVAAQSRIDAVRYRLLGVPGRRIHVVGNMKFDLSIDAGWREKGLAIRTQWGMQRPVWIMASTHESEEAAALAAQREILARHPDALLLLAPRHPERFAGVARLVRATGLSVATRQGDGLPARDTQCFLIDTMGQLLAFYATADIAFVGGTFVPVGGHNVLEPAAFGIPVLVGPHTHHFEGITHTLIQNHGALRVATPDRLGAAVLALFDDPARRMRMGAAARDAFARERGATSRIVALVDDVLAEHSVETGGLPG